MKISIPSPLKRCAIIFLTLGSIQMAAGPTPMAQSSPGAGADDRTPPLTVRVDPRIELLSVLFRLAGNPEYNQGKVESYLTNAEKRFRPHADHPAVQFARELRRRRGVSYDACMSMAIHLSDAEGLNLLVPLKPWPEGLDGRWTAGDATRFLELARRFVRETGFMKFVGEHQGLYEVAETRMTAVMDNEGHLEWFNEYFGEKPEASFTIAPALLNGGSCYGPHYTDGAGREHLYCILGVWKTGADGLPEFTSDMVGTVVHEFGHSFANPIVDRHMAALKPPADKLFRHVSDQMRSQAYGDSQTMLRESLVRACEVRYAARHGGPEAARRTTAYHRSRGFLWTEELSDLLAQYEAQRDRYPTLDAFSPRLVAFFQSYAPKFAAQQEERDGKRPKVVSMRPANEETNADPALTTLQVVFDRPMKDQSWSLVGGGPHCPETTGKPSYDSTRKIWTVPVKLKPDWTYEFMLNSATFDAFRSEEGVPLAPLRVRFKTAKGNPP